MTAPGVMTNGTPAGALLGNLSFQGMSDKLNAKGSFEKVMENAQVAKSQDVKAQDGKPQGVSPKEKKEAATEKAYEQTDNVKEQVKTMFSGKSRVQGKEGPKQTDAPVLEQQDEPVDETMIEAVSTIVVQIRELICETLEISDEELSQTMEELDLTDADLFDRNSLQQLFLVVNEAEDSTEFLTNEALFDDFAEMMQAVEQTVREADLTPESVQEVLSTETGILPEQDIPEVEIASENVLTTVVSGTEQEAKPSVTKDIRKDVAEVDVDTEADSDTVLVSDTDTGTKEDVAGAAQAEEEKVPEAKTAKAEVKTEAKGTEDKSHVVAAKGTAEKKEASTETDGSFKSNFIDALTAKINPAYGSDEALAATQQLREIANQVLEQIKVIIRPEQTNMELQLNPEHLGRVHLTVTEKEGMMTAQFTTQTQIAKEAIESQMAILKESLLNQGIKVEAIEVAVSEFGFERDRDANRNHGEEQGRRRRNQGIRSTETEESVPRMEDYINATDSSIDYSA